jgi:predicted amidophosphoribosyltransferase
MQDILNKLLDTLFPPRPSQIELRLFNSTNLNNTSGCHEGVFYCVEYDQPFIRSVIRENKFYNNRYAQVILAEILEDWIQSKQLEDICFLPIPLGKERLHERGHNQVTSILNQTDYTQAKNVLTRTKETVPQVSLKRQQRLLNVQNIFSCDIEKVSVITAKVIIILDDVTTTGATLNEARATLAPHVPPDTTLLCVALTH